MAHINLLPWREELRNKRKQEFFALIGTAVVITLAAVGLVHMNINGRIDNQNSRNAYLQDQIRQVEAKIREIQNLEKEKSRLIARIQVIEDLQKNRPAIVHLFDEMSKTVPDGVVFNSVKQSGSRLTISGVAQSNARVSSLMRNLDASPWFTNPTLGFIQTMAGGQRSFTLSVQQTIPGGEKAAKTTGKNKKRGK